MPITVEVLKEGRTRYFTQKMLFFWGNGGWHQRMAVQTFIKKDGLIEVIYFRPIILQRKILKHMSGEPGHQPLPPIHLEPVSIDLL